MVQHHFHLNNTTRQQLTAFFLSFYLSTRLYEYWICVTDAATLRLLIQAKGHPHLPSHRTKKSLFTKNIQVNTFTIREGKDNIQCSSKSQR